MVGKVSGFEKHHKATVSRIRPWSSLWGLLREEGISSVWTGEWMGVWMGGHGGGWGEKDF